MENAVNTNQVQQKQNSFRIRKKVVLGIVVLLVIFVIPLTLLYFKNQSPPKSANILVATVGQTPIYKSTIEEIASEQYNPDAITSDVRRQFVDVAIERIILDLEDKELDIPIVQTGTKNEYYHELKKYIVQQQTRSIDVFDVSFWIPPPTSYPQKPEFELMRVDGKKAADEIEVRLRDGEQAVDIAKSLADKYPNLQPILAVNGYLINNAIDENQLRQPRTYVYNKENEGKQFFDTLFSLKDGDISKNIWEDGSGASVIKVIKVSKSGDITYEEWLSQKKKKLVKYNDKGMKSL